jgi:hypothetical protein
MWRYFSVNSDADSLICFFLHRIFVLETMSAMHYIILLSLPFDCFSCNYSMLQITETCCLTLWVLWFQIICWNYHQSGFRFFVLRISSFSKWLILTTGLCLDDTLGCELHTKDGSAQGGQWLATTQEMGMTLTWLACLLCTFAFLFWGFVGSLNVYLICQKGVKTGIMCCCCLFQILWFPIHLGK